ncbi:MAG: hypothetical protein M0C28_20895 [Candidatus Moduliflexus flocculans]|nr:hypothetical protein [Candidatus Moduliflexus flocculans]
MAVHRSRPTSSSSAPGPAGLTAGLYVARAGKKALILEGRGPSRLAIPYTLENYPGFPSIDSAELLAIIRTQAASFGAEVVAGRRHRLRPRRRIPSTSRPRRPSSRPARSSWPRASPCPRSG